jgi:fructose-1,6-bisphosphatase II
VGTQADAVDRFVADLPLLCAASRLQGVIAAAALKCMGGSIQGRLWARNEEEAEAIRASGRDTTRILYTEDLVRGNDVSAVVACHRDM